MNELKDYQSILKEKAECADVFFKKYPDLMPSQARLFGELNDTKIRTVAPEIMVYGIYNAGKSSILNELIGSDVASVKDVPETDKVTYYDWQGYKIADTPGVAAPIAHENVTQEHLKKADIVLFVMSTTGSNEKMENYVRMKFIAEAGKKIIIVLNDKNGDMGRNDSSIQLIKQQVANNMQRIGIENVDEKYCIVTVNAVRARKGRLEQKSGLSEKSGMDELRNVMINELKRTSSFHILRNAIRQLETILEEFASALEKQENSMILQKMNHVLETFSKQKLLMRREINTFIDTQADLFGTNLPQIIWSHRDETERMNKAIEKESGRLTQKVQEEIQRQIEDAVSILSMELRSFAEIKMDSQCADAESFKAIMEKLAKVDETFAENMAEEKSATRSGDGAAAIAATAGTVEIATGLVSESGKIIANHLAKTAIGKAIARTAAGKLLGSVAGTVIPIIGPIITIVSVIGALKSFLGGNDDREALEARLEQQNARERQRVEAEKQARQELNQKCLYLADNLAGELKASANESVTEILSQYEIPFREEIDARRADGQQLMADIESLRALYNEYDLLRVELGDR